MPEKYEFRGGPKWDGRVILAIPVLGIVMLAIGIFAYIGPQHEMRHILFGVVLIAMGLAFYFYAVRPKTVILTDISFKFVKEGKPVFEAVWGEISMVKLGMTYEGGQICLAVHIKGRPRVLISSELDFPETVLEQIFTTITGIREKYRYTQLNVVRGEIPAWEK